MLKTLLQMSVLVMVVVGLIWFFSRDKELPAPNYTPIPEATEVQFNWSEEGKG